MTQVKRGRGRPRKSESRADSRPRRTPVSGYRDLLVVLGKDPDYHYRFVKDVSDNGTRILRYLNGGYDLVTTDDNLQIGQEYVYKTENIGSVYRVPADPSLGTYYYLMKIRKDWYEEDQELKEDALLDIEESIYGPDENKGQYGSVKVGSQ